MPITIQLTDDLKLQPLVLSEGVTISGTFVFFTIEVLDGFVIEEAIGMNAARNLLTKVRLRTAVFPGNYTYHITFIHLPSQLRAPTCQTYAGSD